MLCLKTSRIASKFLKVAHQKLFKCPVGDSLYACEHINLFDIFLVIDLVFFFCTLVLIILISGIFSINCINVFVMPQFDWLCGYVMSPTSDIYWIDLSFINNYKELQLWLVILRYNADIASIALSLGCYSFRIGLVILY